MHVYVHVPFCARRCSYCDFSIAVRRVVPDAAYVEAIAGEWRARQDALPGDSLATLYFGGGTPSRLAPSALGDLIGIITGDRALAPTAEVTIEVNPDDVTRDAATTWAAAGVNRASLGVQSHDPRVLEWMHRTHRVEQVVPAVGMLRDAGITNISIDLIFALPASLERDWAGDVRSTLDLNPSHVSLYGLTVEPRTPLARWTARGDVSPTDDERYAREYLEVNAALTGQGFEHYEVSNAARAGYASQHNSAYWSGAQYLGLGPSAHSLIGGSRSWNVRDWEEYRRRTTQGAQTRDGQEALGGPEQRLELLYLGLRTTGGVSIAAIPADARAAWVAAGWATELEGVIVLSPEGWLRLDALVAAVADS